MRLNETIESAELLEAKDLNTIKGGGRDTRGTSISSFDYSITTTTTKQK